MLMIKNAESAIFLHNNISLRLCSNGDQERYIPEQTDIEET